MLKLGFIHVGNSVVTDVHFRDCFLLKHPYPSLSINQNIIIWVSVALLGKFN